MVDWNSINYIFPSFCYCNNFNGGVLENCDKKVIFIITFKEFYFLITDNFPVNILWKDW